jgi:hypothetical protein
MNVQASDLLRSAVPVVCGLLLATGALAQTSPPPGPTVPDKAIPEKMLPVPRPGDDMVLNPTLEECRAGWRPGLKWTKAQFEKFCTQLDISK